MYKKLRYEQYFIDTTGDINKTGKASFEIKYKSVDYTYKNILTHANYCIRYDEKRNVIQVHFEGTKDVPDWVCNFFFQPKYYDSFTWNDKKITLKVHKSWATMYKAMKGIVRDTVKDLLELHKDAEVEIIGWSLGSSQAMLCSQDLNYNLGIQSHLFTFGSVNPFKINLFTKNKTIKYLRSCCKSYHIICNKNDFVSYLVPRIFGFVKIHRLNLKGTFNFFGLFNIAKNHYCYDQRDLYRNIYKKEREC